MDGGPPCFPQNSSCSVVLWIPVACSPFRVRVFYPLRRRLSSLLLLKLTILILVRNPKRYCYLLVWPLPRSLATTYGISFDFFSWGYLDVSVPPVSPAHTMYSCTHNRAFTPVGFPHSDICGSIGYLRLSAAFRSLSRPSSAPSAKASALCSSSLDLLRVMNIYLLLTL